MACYTRSEWNRALRDISEAKIGDLVWVPGPGRSKARGTRVPALVLSGSRVPVCVMNQAVKGLRIGTVVYFIAIWNVTDGSAT